MGGVTIFIYIYIYIHTILLLLGPFVVKGEPLQLACRRPLRDPFPKPQGPKL